MSGEDEDAWRTSELVQWLFRSAIRDEVGSPVQAFFASEKMLTLVQDWLSGSQSDRTYDPPDCSAALAA